MATVRTPEKDWGDGSLRKCSIKSRVRWCVPLLPVLWRLRRGSLGLAGWPVRPNSKSQVPLTHPVSKNQGGQLPWGTIPKVALWPPDASAHTAICTYTHASAIHMHMNICLLTYNHQKISQCLKRWEIRVLGITGEKVKFCSCSGKIMCQFLENIKMELPYDPAFLFLGICPEEMETGTWTESVAQCSQPRYHKSQEEEAVQMSIHRPTAFSSPFMQWNSPNKEGNSDKCYSREELPKHYAKLCEQSQRHRQHDSSFIKFLPGANS